MMSPESVNFCLSLMLFDGPSFDITSYRMVHLCLYHSYYGINVYLCIHSRGHLKFYFNFFFLVKCQMFLIEKGEDESCLQRFQEAPASDLMPSGGIDWWFMKEQEE